MNDRDDRIREIAYVLWLEAGCPEGQAECHWHDAEALLDSDPEAFESQRVKGAPADGPAESDVSLTGLPG